MLSSYRKNCYLHQKQILLVLSLVTLIFSTPTFATRIVNLDEIINLSNQVRNKDKDIVKKNGQADFTTLSTTLTKCFSEFNKRIKLIIEIRPQFENIKAKLKEYCGYQVINLSTKNIKYRNTLDRIAISHKSSNILKSIVSNPKADAMVLKFVVKNVKTDDSARAAIAQQIETPAITLMSIAENKEASNSTLKLIIKHPKVDSNTLRIIAQHPIASKDSNILAAIINHPKVDIYTLLVIAQYPHSSEDKCKNTVTQLYLDYNIVEATEVFLSNLVFNKDIAIGSEIFTSIAKLKQFNDYDLIKLKSDAAVVADVSLISQKLIALIIKNKYMLENIKTDQVLLKLTDEEIIKKLQEECEIIKGANICCEQSQGIEQDSAAVTFKWYAKAASQGSVNAQYRLGVYYENGIGIKRDEKMALEWYRKAASQGNVDAQYRLGFCYEKGLLRVEKNEKMAIEWYKLAANHEHADAQYCLGVCYEDGIGVKRDEKMAFKWYELAANHEHANAQYHLGLCYQNGSLGATRNIDTAFEWYGIAASYGQKNAQDMLYNHGTDKSLEKPHTLESLRRPVGLGYSQIQRLIGCIYQDSNEKVIQKEQTAVLWYKKAVSCPCYIMMENHNEDVWRDCIKIDVKTGKIEMNANVFFCETGKEILYGLRLRGGFICTEEKIEIRDAKKLLEIIKGFGIINKNKNVKLTSEQIKLIPKVFGAPDCNGDACAQYRLGVCYEEGRGVKKDIKIAIEWYKKSVNNNNNSNKIEKFGIDFRADAKKRLEVLHEEGLRIEKEEERVLEWYKKAASQGDATALYQLGVCYEQGLFGAEKNETMAITWYKLAASHGHAEACYRLGVYYEQDLSIKKDGKVAGDTEYDENEEQRIRLSLFEEIKKVEQKYEKANSKQIVADQQCEQNIALTQNALAPILTIQANDGVNFNKEELKKAFASNSDPKLTLIVNDDEEKADESNANEDADKAFIFDNDDD